MYVSVSHTFFFAADLTPLTSLAAGVESLLLLLLLLLPKPLLAVPGLDKALSFCRIADGLSSSAQGVIEG